MIRRCRFVIATALLGIAFATAVRAQTHGRIGGIVKSPDARRSPPDSLAQKIVGKGASSPNLATAHSVLACCALSQGKTAVAIANLEKALALDPASKLAAENRSMLETLKK